MKTCIVCIAFVATLFFAGCSSKKVFEPKEIAGDWKYYGKSDEKIIGIASDAALLKNKKVISKTHYFDVNVAENFRVIGVSDGWVLSTNIDGNLTLDSVEKERAQEVLGLKKTVAAASVQGDTVAVLFSDNEIALYSLATKEPLFKEQGNPPVIVDARIVNPHFMGDLALFLTLDGKVIIVNTKLKKRLRTVIVSTQEHFNNIIYFTILESKLIAATAHKLFSMGEKEIRANHEIRNIAVDTKNIYITTKQGELLSLTPNLDVNAKIKFPFAHFLGIIAYEEKLYLLEKQGYLIEVEKDFTSYKIYEADVPNGYIFSADTIFYADDTYISVR